MPWPFVPSSCFFVWPTHLAPAIIAAWIILVFGFRWKLDRGSIDLLGILLGMGWIALDVTQFAFEFWP
jgi:hypothetical protein